MSWSNEIFSRIRICPERFILVFRIQRCTCTKILHTCLEGWDHYIRLLQDFQLLQLCEEVNTAEVVVANRKENTTNFFSTDHYYGETLSELSEYKNDFNSDIETKEFLIGFNKQKLISLSCKFQKSIVYLTHNKNFDGYFIFAKKKNDEMPKLLAHFVNQITLTLVDSLPQTLERIFKNKNPCMYSNT